MKAESVAEEKLNDPLLLLNKKAKQLISAKWTFNLKQNQKYSILGIFRKVFLLVRII